MLIHRLIKEDYSAEDFAGRSLWHYGNCRCGGITQRDMHSGKGDRTVVHELIEEFKAGGADLERMSAKDEAVIMEICNQKNHILWINAHNRIEPVFINDAGKQYYGFEHNNLKEDGFLLYKQFLHPDDFADVHKTIEFFNRHPHATFRKPYHIKDSKGRWRWTYSIAKALNFTPEGTPNYILAIVYDIENLLEFNHNDEKQNFIALNREKFETLTEREKQILDLIAREYTSHEIAEKLFIESSTVDTHRKHIIKKLEVKSSLGLVRYALAYITPYM